MTEPAILITRPEPGAGRFAEQLRAAIGADLQCLISPVISIEIVETPPPAGPWTGLIVTSQNGARGLAHFDPDLTPPVWTIGPHTTARVRDAGFAIAGTAPDVETLAGMILSAHPDGPLLHLRGEHSRGDLAQRLTQGGVSCQSHITYRQPEQPLSPDARDLLNGTAPVILPVFSPRSGSILARNAPFAAPVHWVCISAAAAGAAAAPDAVIAPTPDAKGMISAVFSVFRSAARLESR